MGQTATADRRVAARRANLPEVSYPPALPISQQTEEIRAVIRDHQVVIVAGETGSGKTTQLPKICLELGRGVQGMIGHTQPRRLAARTVAERIAEELHTPLGGAVGYQVRFTDQVGDGTLVKLMTDGILLAELRRDRMLRAYDTLIVDEAHERSLNVDFILGYLKRLLPRRPDLKVVITSATIDPERFSRHFGGAPVVEVSGRTYPVEVRYRPIAAEAGDADRDQTQAVCDAVDELSAEGGGDVLVFLSGEREIRDTADALRRIVRPDTEILPLYARLSAAEQHRVFKPHAGRRVVLATNVAETSLTVPGIRYVVDPGTARISRYSHRTKVQRLPIEPISQASANQRKGRCGRVAAGICIRLYSEEDFAARPEFTEPEILRTNLASVILQMTALGLGEVAGFPFIDPPDRRDVKAGVQLLEELGALRPAGQAARGRLTPVGRQLAQLPLDPRLARMVVEAGRNGCVREVMVVAAALSIQDPRERPTDRQEAADQSHRRFADPGSDFLAYLNLWQYLRERQKALSSSQFRRLCKAEFLNYLRVREWQDIYGQLRQTVKPLGIALNRDPADPHAVHLSLLAGLLSHIGLKDGEKQEYLGARGARFAIFPGSALFKKPPRWVMAAELVETSRLWARTTARIEPEWIEPLAGHLVKRSYSEPHWERDRGAVMAYERVTLYGLPIVARRKAGYARVDPLLSRELFIREALVAGDWDTHHAFFGANRKLLEEVADLEDRARRRDILVDEQALFDFYDRRVPEEVVSARHFDAWWKRASRSQPGLLDFSPGMLIDTRAGAVSPLDYPDSWRQGDLDLRLTYQFEPGGDADGVTVEVPLPLLNQVSADGFDWQVPGFRQELVAALLRTLPKPLRRRLVPLRDTATELLRRLEPLRAPLPDALGEELGRMGVEVPRGAWQPERVPDHLRVTFRVLGEDGRTLDQDKDLEALKARLVGEVRGALSARAGSVERQGLRDWEIGTLPRTVERRRGGYQVTAYPALVDEGDGVAVRLLESRAEQERAMWPGTRRLLLQTVPSPLRALRDRLSGQARLALSQNPHGTIAELLDDCVACAVDELVADGGGPAWDRAGFERLRDHVRAGLHDATVEVFTTVQRILEAAHRVRRLLAEVDGTALQPAVDDLTDQLSGLVYPGFVSATGWRRLPDVLRYLRAMEQRLRKLPDNPGRDHDRMLRVQEVQAAYERLRDELPGAADAEALERIRWMVEELRVSLFAEALGTPEPVSEKRVYRAMDQLSS
ncbi:MAG TPA: ATP-dependent RNA helicase HrpA [Actinomycetota bacterium]|jgi:ATP-dependent helicase HrpA